MTACLSKHVAEYEWSIYQVNKQNWVVLALTEFQYNGTNTIKEAKQCTLRNITGV